MWMKSLFTRTVLRRCHWLAVFHLPALNSLYGTIWNAFLSFCLLENLLKWTALDIKCNIFTVEVDKENENLFWSQPHTFAFVTSRGKRRCFSYFFSLADDQNGRHMRAAIVLASHQRPSFSEWLWKYSIFSIFFCALRQRKTETLLTFILAQLF